MAIMKIGKEVSENINSQLPQVKIQSKSHEQLLNVIDHLRSQGLSHHIALPQLIVCGDQSSGKSSVLEAVSNIRFPSADDTCTRFATELVLRRASSTSTAISIVPDVDRPEHEQEKLRSFKTDLSITDDFPSIVEEAMKVMGLEKSGSGGKAIGKDRLRIEVNGPSQPHLTLVDLPGLIHNPGKNLTQNDVDAVRELVIEYMKNPRSIILTVITAKNDFNNQAVTAYAKKYDPELKRTLGIITKPDDLPDNSARQQSFRKLVENKSEHLNLGWHILKNREYGQENFTSEQRDQSEIDFFNRESWQSLNPTLKGIGQLRPRLSQVLQGHILAELPSLIQDVQNGINECEATLSRLGGPRASKAEQSEYLHTVSFAFTKLVKNAIDGYYEDEYFGNAATDQGYAKRTRAIVTNSLEEFARDIALKGHKTQTISDDELNSDSDADSNSDSDEPLNFPIRRTKSQRLEDISTIIKRNRGRELACFMKAEIITQLFRDQCHPWTGLVRTCADRIFDETRYSLYLALEATADPVTKEGILRTIINPALEEIERTLTLKVTETLEQHAHGTPITFNHYLTDNIQKLRQEHNKAFLAERIGTYFGTIPLSDDSGHYIAKGKWDVNTKILVERLATSTEADMTKFACSEALHFMEAYYKVARKFFVDDFAIHAIEECLLKKVPYIFDSSTVRKLNEEAIEDIAGETEESKAERSACTKKFEVLREALSTLHRFERSPRGGVKKALPNGLKKEEVTDQVKRTVAR